MIAFHDNPALTEVTRLARRWPRAYLRGAVIQIARSRHCVAIEIDGRLAALCGLWPEEAHDEFWMLARPDLRERKVGVKLIRGLRLLLANVWDRRRPLVAMTKVGHIPGERLAAVLGFVNAGPGLDGAVTLWRLAPYVDAANDPLTCPADEAEREPEP